VKQLSIGVRYRCCNRLGRGHHKGRCRRPWPRGRSDATEHRRCRPDACAYHLPVVADIPIPPRLLDDFRRRIYRDRACLYRGADGLVASNFRGKSAPPREALPITVAIFGLLVHLISFIRVIRQITGLADPYFMTDDRGRRERIGGFAAHQVTETAICQLADYCTCRNQTSFRWASTFA